MGWAYGHNQEGREVGYSVPATCDLEGCYTRIDRGLYYVCGDMHDGGDFGCGGYFCAQHLSYYSLEESNGERVHSQLCDKCGAQVKDLDDEEN